MVCENSLTAMRALLVELDAGLLEPEPIDIRPAAGGEHHLVDHDLLMIGQRNVRGRDRPSRPPSTICLGDDLDAALFHLGAQMLAHVVVEAAQDVVAAIDQRHLGAEPVEDAGELDRDIAAALDQDALGQFLEMERLVRRDDVLEARDLLAERRASRRSRSGCAWRAPSRRSPRARTVCGSSITARLLTISTLARSRLAV